MIGANKKEEDEKASNCNNVRLSTGNPLPEHSSIFNSQNESRLSKVEVSQKEVADSFTSCSYDIQMSAKNKCAVTSTSSPLETLAMACLISDTGGVLKNENKNKDHQQPEISFMGGRAPGSSNLANERVNVSHVQTTNTNMYSRQIPSSNSTLDDSICSTSSTQNTSEESFVSINDVLCGRGGLTNHHSGNIFFRKLVRRHQETYLLASKRDKASVARQIVDTIRSLNPPGRFLKKTKQGTKSGYKKGSDHNDYIPGDSSTGVWVEIGDKKAREKTSQALRERAPELREQQKAQSQQQQQRLRSPQLIGREEHEVDTYIPSCTSTVSRQENPSACNVRVVSCGSINSITKANVGTPTENLSRSTLQTSQSQTKRQKFSHIIINDSCTSVPESSQFLTPTVTPSIPPCASQAKGVVGVRQEGDVDEHTTTLTEDFCGHLKGVSVQGNSGPRVKMLKDRVQKVA